MSDKLRLDDLQSDGGLFAPTRPLHQVNQVQEEQRQSARKPMEANGTLMVDGTEVAIKTIDISHGGLCIRAARQLAVGKEYPLSFDLATADGIRRVALTIDVIYCFHTEDRDFKMGVEFINPAPAVVDAIRQFVDSAS